MFQSKRPLLLLLTILVVMIAGAQPVSREKLIGKWTLKSHALVTGNDTSVMKYRPLSGQTYTFHADNTFRLKFYGDASELGIKGKWKLNELTSQVSFSDIKTTQPESDLPPPPPPVDYSKVVLVLSSFSDSGFQTKEMLPHNRKAGVSVYMKVAD